VKLTGTIWAPEPLAGISWKGRTSVQGGVKYVAKDRGWFRL
jgi:hypothetical protein